jgi:hypothetical protein
LQCGFQQRALPFGDRVVRAVAPCGEIHVLECVVQGVAEARAREIATSRDRSALREDDRPLVVRRRFFRERLRAMRMLPMQLAEAVDPPVAAQGDDAPCAARARARARRVQGARYRAVRQVFAHHERTAEPEAHRRPRQDAAEQAKQRALLVRGERPAAHP